MKITYLRLENVAGIYMGMQQNILEISFEKSKNKIICILAENARGKSVLLSSLHPFSGVSSIDERSSLNYIITKKNGYKEIHYDKNGDEIVIKHYYKPNKDSHTIKSYFMLNGKELNKNGNVRSFLSLVEIHFGLTEDMMRLISLGSNLSSFTKLTPAKRKEYIGRLINEIDSYMIIHKNINDDLRVVRTMINVNNSNLYKCHIDDPIVENEKLVQYRRDIRELEKKRDKIVGKISKIKSLMSGNDIHELRKQKKYIESSLIELDKVSGEIKSLKLEDTNVDQLMKKRSTISDEKITTQAKINSYRISIDNLLNEIDRLEVSIKKVTSNNDIKSLMDLIEDLKLKLNSSIRLIKGFTPLGSSSDQVQYLISKLSSYNQIAQMIYTLGNKPLNLYIKIVETSKMSVEKFLKEQSKRIMNNINRSDLELMLKQIFDSEDIITPNCDDQYADCPYYKLSKVINESINDVDNEVYDSETLRYVQVISNNIDNILNEIDSMRDIKIPDRLRDSMRETNILDRMKSHLPFFDLMGFNDYLSILKEYEIHVENNKKLKEYEYQLSIYKQSGIDSQMSRINELKENIEFYKKNISVLSSQLSELDNRLSDVDNQISLVTRYQSGKKLESSLKLNIESIDKVLIPLENASNEKTELDFSLTHITNAIDQTRALYRDLEMKISDYEKLVKEGERLAIKHKHLSMILNLTSTKEGIPVIHIRRYLKRIRKLANNLLSIIYDDELRLDKFDVNDDTFEIPYVKNGKRVSDIKYSSQSEIALTTMALSFALANEASKVYNILSLDEIDAGLDESNRSSFLKMLYTQMESLNVEQVFMISHNMSQMVNIPMDCILLSNDIKINPRYQNVIFKAV